MISQSPIEQLQTKLNVSFKCPNTITYFIKFGIEGMMCAVKITDATRLFSLEEHPILIWIRIIAFLVINPQLLVQGN